MDEESRVKEEETLNKLWELYNKSLDDGDRESANWYLLQIKSIEEGQASRIKVDIDAYNAKCRLEFEKECHDDDILEKANDRDENKKERIVRIILGTIAAVGSVGLGAIKVVGAFKNTDHFLDKYEGIQKEYAHPDSNEFKYGLQAGNELFK